MCFNKLAGIAVLMAGMMLSPSVMAHGAIEDQIDNLDARLAITPDKSDLYLQRGRLLLDDGDYRSAVEDFSYALQLDAKQTVAHYFLAVSLVKVNRAIEAEREARLFLSLLHSQDNGGKVRGYRVLGQSLMQQHRALTAAYTLSRSLQVAQNPLPDLYLECATAYSMAGRTPLALEALDSGLAKLGLLPALQEKAISINLQTGDWQSALNRLDSLLATGKMQAYLHYRKAEVLAQAGQTEAARQAYQASLQTISNLKPTRQQSKPILKLSADIQYGLAALNILKTKQ